MARTAIVFGLLLCGLTLYGLIAATTKSPFQFVPLMFGIPVMFCGLVGLNPHRQRVTGMIASVIMTFGMFSGLCATIRCVMHWSEHQPLRPVIFAMGSLMTVVCLVFLVVSVLRAAKDRRRRRSLKKTPPPEFPAVQLATSDRTFTAPVTRLETVEPMPQPSGPVQRGD